MYLLNFCKDSFKWKWKYLIIFIPFLLSSIDVIILYLKPASFYNEILEKASLNSENRFEVSYGLFSLNKQGLTGGLAGRSDASQQWKTNGDSIFGFKVGIGTTVGTAALGIGGTGQTTANLTDAGCRTGIIEIIPLGGAAGNGGALVLGSDTWGNGVGKGQIALKALLTDGSGCGVSDLAFSLRNNSACSNLTERMRITSAGNVLIGATTTCKGLLRVAGDAEVCKTLFFNGGDGNGGAIGNAGTSSSCATVAYNVRTLFNFNNMTNYGAFMFIHTTYSGNGGGGQGTITGIVTNVFD